MMGRLSSRWGCVKDVGRRLSLTGGKRGVDGRSVVGGGNGGDVGG